MHLVDNRRILLFHLGEFDIAVANKMVALLAGAFRSSAIKTLLPGIHALADMHPAVVDKGGLDDLVSGCGKQAAHRITEKIIANMSEMQGFVGVGR